MDAQICPVSLVSAFQSKTEMVYCDIILVSYEAPNRKREKGNSCAMQNP